MKCPWCGNEDAPVKAFAYRFKRRKRVLICISCKGVRS